MNVQGPNGTVNPVNNGRPLPPPTPGVYTPTSSPPPADPRKDIAPIIIVALIIGCIAIASLALFIVPPGDPDMTANDTTDGTTDGTTDNVVTIKEGDYADYRLTMSNGTMFYVGICHISYSNVTATSVTMTVTMDVRNYHNTTSTVIDLSGGSSAAEGLSDTSSGSGSSTWNTVIGTETIQTFLGPRECTHSREVTSSYVEDYWYGEVNMFKLTRTYTDGSQTILEITGTNMSSA